jgi:hypothetical protein
MHVNLTVENGSGVFILSGDLTLLMTYLYLQMLRRAMMQTCRAYGFLAAPKHYVAVNKRLIMGSQPDMMRFMFVGRNVSLLSKTRQIIRTPSPPISTQDMGYRRTRTLSSQVLTCALHLATT